MDTNQTTTARTADTSALDDPIVFAHTLFANMVEPAALLAPLDGIMGELSETVYQLRTILAEQPEAKALLFRLDDLASSATVEAHSMGIEFGVHAETLRQALSASSAGPREPR